MVIYSGETVTHVSVQRGSLVSDVMSPFISLRPSSDFALTRRRDLLRSDLSSGDVAFPAAVARDVTRVHAAPLLPSRQVASLASNL